MNKGEQPAESEEQLEFSKMGLRAEGESDQSGGRNYEGVVEISDAPVDADARTDFRPEDQEDERELVSPEKADMVMRAKELLDRAGYPEGDHDRESFLARILRMSQDEIAYCAYSIREIEEAAVKWGHRELKERMPALFGEVFSHEGQQERLLKNINEALEPGGVAEVREHERRPETEEEIARYARNKFGPLAFVSPKIFSERFDDEAKAHFVNYLRFKLNKMIRTKEDRFFLSDDAEGAVDTVGAVLGVDTPEFHLLARIARARGDEDAEHMNSLFRMPMDVAFRRYLDVDIEQLVPEYYKYFDYKKNAERSEAL